MDTESLFGVKGKNVLITGGAKGIGRMMAEGFVRNGAKVFLAGRDAAALDAAVAELLPLSPTGTAPVAIPANLQDLEACRAVADRLAADLSGSGLHVLVNNAGAAWGAPIDEFPDSGWSKVLMLNLQRVFTLTQMCLPLLEQAAKGSATTVGEGNDAFTTFADPARVIHIGSIDGIRVPMFNNYAYSASKAGLHHLSAHLARDLGPRGVTSNVIACGAFPTKMLRSGVGGGDFDFIAAETPVRRIGQPTDAAGTALYLSSKASAFITGAVIRLDGGSALLGKL